MQKQRIKGIPIRYQNNLSLKSVIFLTKYKKILSKDNEESDLFYKENYNGFKTKKEDISKYIKIIEKIKSNVKEPCKQNSFESWKINNPLKIRAHKIVYSAKRNGTLVEQPCERCGNERVHAHHEDYNFPLDVMWLCLSCHVQRHKELGWGFGQKTYQQGVS